MLGGVDGVCDLGCGDCGVDGDLGGDLGGEEQFVGAEVHGAHVDDRLDAVAG
ncbi:hypothetical protein [Actinophytocola gossypii]|uniref:hypothetical protein n=1 Tax=Actinophytocola gossypii TaxID=2812003 RepID=UPI0035CCF628